MEITTSDKISCHLCSITFSLRKNLYVHMRKIHGQVGEKDPVPKRKCELCSICGNMFSNKSNLSRHMDTKHSFKMLKNRGRIQCPDCKEFFSNHNLYRDHLIKQHEIILIKEDYKFNLEEEFQEWKNEIQLGSISHYVLDTSIVTLSDNKKKRYYNCHRSHLYRSCSQGIRAPKGLISNKIGTTCPARMEVLIENDSYSVQFWKTHVGHSIDVGRCFLSRQIRSEIAGKLKQGVAFQHILNEIRDSDMQSQRILLLERKDLHNITRDFSLQYSTRHHADDAVSVKLWVEDMKALNDECPVLYFKEQGKEDGGLFSIDDFCLIIMTSFQSDQLKKFGINKICIDGTHGTNSYHFQLYTLLTVDEFSSGCPVAFCISNRSDELLFKIFFEHIRLKVGLIKAETFMSDDAPAFYNAWSNIMGSVPNKLLCTWHVDRNWQQNLSKISGGSEVKALVYKTLRVLLQETHVEKFEKCAFQVLKDLLSDPNTHNFGQYFQTYYMNRCKEWAYCYRVGLGINTNMYLESLHRTLKHIYLEGKKVKRLDKSINAIMSLARDSLFKRLIKLAKNKPTDQLNSIRKSHKTSNAIDINSIKVLRDNDEWLITSDNSRKYVVCRRETDCSECIVKCYDCNICIHEFKCTCVDNIIKLNICKHIHACVRHKVYQNISAGGMSIKNSSLTEVQDILNVKVNKLRIKPSIFDTIKKKCELIIGLCFDTLDVTKDESNLIMKNLDKVISVLNKKSVTLKTKENVNINKKIEKQTRLFSTKKIKPKKSSFKHPTPTEIKNIEEGLSNTDTKMLNIHTNFDHTYTS